MRWSGEAFEPLDRFKRKADEQYTVGEVYAIDAQQPRSKASHSHYFACVHEAWKNLPETIASQFPDAETLRKYALIKTGYSDQWSYVCGNKTEARRLAAFLRPLEEFAVITATEATVTMYTARSQSGRAMGREEFQKSKDDVLNFLSELIGTSVTDLKKAS